MTTPTQPDTAQADYESRCLYCLCTYPISQLDASGECASCRQIGQPLRTAPAPAPAAPEVQSKSLLKREAVLRGEGLPGDDYDTAAHVEPMNRSSLIALALAFGGTGVESRVADILGSEPWDNLCSLGYVSTMRDPSDEYETNITRAGRQALYIAALDAHNKSSSSVRESLAPAAPDVTEASGGDVVEQIIREVAELPDRSSPDEWPEAMLVTADELRTICKPITDASAAALELACDGIRLRETWVRESDKRGDEFRAALSAARAEVEALKRDQDEFARATLPKIDWIENHVRVIVAERDAARAELAAVKGVVDKLPKCWRLNDAGELVQDAPITPSMTVWVVWSRKAHKCTIGGIWGDSADAYYDGEPVAGEKYATEPAALATSATKPATDTKE